MEPRRSSVSPLRTRERSRTLGLRKTTHGSRSGRSNGWAECREKKIGIEPMGSTFFLTSPLIGHCYIALKSCHKIKSPGTGCRYCGYSQEPFRFPYLPALIRRIEIASVSASSFIWSALIRRQNLHPTNAYSCELPSHANGVA